MPVETKIEAGRIEAVGNTYGARIFSFTEVSRRIVALF